jgi:hypothetical protein
MKEVVTEIQIDASPDKVWRVLTANEEWAVWNPFITKSAGALVVGQKITNTMEMKGQKPMTFKPTVLKADTAKELRWLGRLILPGLFDGEHYFKLEASDGGTKFTQGEIFRGILIGMLNMDDVRASFGELNAALKKRVEA